VVTGIDHAVTDEDMSTGMAAGQGVFRAICGVLVTPDALTAPPRRVCPGCWAVMRPPVRVERGKVLVARRGHRRPGWLRCWATSVFRRSASGTR
jgi:hypothetical protein